MTALGVNLPLTVGLYNVFCSGGLMTRFDLLHLHSVE
jgi:hypothetical protein